MGCTRETRQSREKWCTWGRKKKAKNKQRKVFKNAQEYWAFIQFNLSGDRHRFIIKTWAKSRENSRSGFISGESRSSTVLKFRLYDLVKTSQKMILLVLCVLKNYKKMSNFLWSFTQFWHKASIIIYLLQKLTIVRL